MTRRFDIQQGFEAFEAVLRDNPALVCHPGPLTGLLRERLTALWGPAAQLLEITVILEPNGVRVALTVPSCRDERFFNPENN